MPHYEIAIVGRMGPVVASCVPEFHLLAATTTVLRAVVANHGVVDLLELLADHHLTPIDIRITPVFADHPSSTPHGERAGSNSAGQPAATAESSRR